MQEQLRPCNVCRRPFPISEFLRRSDGRLINSRCHECNAAKSHKFIRSPHGRYLMCRSIAKRRKLPWEVSEDVYVRLISQPCTFCGYPLPETGLGLDRLDSGAGYTPENVVPCCWECNQAKSTVFTFDEMKVIGAAIGAVKAARVAAGIPLNQRDGSSRGWGRPRKYPKPA